MASQPQCSAASDWAPLSCLLLGWPSRGDVWRENAAPARLAITSFLHKLVAYADERIVLVANAVDARAVAAARAAVASLHAPTDRVIVLALPIDDCWMRDITPFFLIAAGRPVVPVCFRFNAWGGAMGGCYTTFDLDARFAPRICKALDLGAQAQKADYVLEGGSVSCDGAGTALTTEECLLSPNRNGVLSRHSVELTLRTHLRLSKILWLPLGAPADGDTDGHVDNLAVFIAPATILLAAPAPGQEAPPDAARRSDAARAALSGVTDACGRPITIHSVRFPPPLTRSEKEAIGVHSIDGTKSRPAGEPLAASYINLVQTARTVFVPAFGIPDCDTAAKAEVEAAFRGTGKTIVSVDAREFVLAGGGIHCLSANVPATREQADTVFAE